MSLFMCQAKENPSVRKPAVAGQFYTDNPTQLRIEVESFLAAGKSLPVMPRIIISPHAGYVFSGPVAGIGYATIARNIKKVILIGPSHHKFFEGISIAEVDAYETPLGQIPLAVNDIAKLRPNPIVHAYPDADNREHCLEVQLPFLQVLLSEFSIIPVVVGKADPSAIADAIFPLIDTATLVVISSDLTHYHSHNQAKAIDRESIATILRGDIEGPIDGCGELPIRSAMLLAKKMGLSPRLMDARNSFETCPHYGTRDRVVGYASIIYLPVEATLPTDEAKFAPIGKRLPPQATMNESDQAFLLKLARDALTSAVQGAALSLPSNIPGMAVEKRGCFVTLTKYGELRGCIGYLEGIKPLYQAVADNAKNAALNDPRFPVVTPAELKDIKVEISVLTTPEPFVYAHADDLLSQLTPGRDGLILSVGNRQSTFLPQVWEQLPDKVAFLEHLARKAGLPADAWREANYKRYFALHFEE